MVRAQFTRSSGVWTVHPGRAPTLPPAGKFGRVAVQNSQQMGHVGPTALPRVPHFGSKDRLISFAAGSLMGCCR